MSATIIASSSTNDDNGISKGEEPKKRKRGHEWVRVIMRLWTLLRRRHVREADR